MIHCPQTDLIQDYLDDELVPAERLAFESHLGSCRACAAELAMYQGVFGRLDKIETFDPGPEFTERVLAQVMPPAQVAWSKGLGLAYVSALGTSVALAVAAFVFPAPRERTARTCARPAGRPVLRTGRSSRHVRR